jgi:hypothetical protein
MVARELILSIDDDARRVAWSMVGSPMTHHNASAQVFAEPSGRTRFVWTADLLPHDFAATVAPMMEQGLATMKQTLERAERR